MRKLWKMQARDPGSSARAGRLRAMDGRRLPTPLFQPVATAASLKALDWGDVWEIGYRHVLMNTYHLVLRPGTAQLEAAGGVKAYCGWPGSVLTDSGGYQVHSLAALRKLRPDGIHFRDHLEGRLWDFTPEFVLRAQLSFGVDFAMPLDVCTSLPATREQTARDMELTHAWAVQQSMLWPELLAERHKAQGVRRKEGKKGAGANGSTSSLTPYALRLMPSLFGIVQGGLEEELRCESAALIASLDFDGIAVGGLAVGEAREDYLRLTEFCGPLLPPDKVHYLMGVGNPADLLHAIAQGFDLFDCVQPTRMARHGVLYTSAGLLRLNNARFREDALPPDPHCGCRCCALHSRAYLRHLLKLGEHSYARLATIHNLYFYYRLMRRARRRILRGTYSPWWQAEALRLSRDLPAGL